MTTFTVQQDIKSQKTRFSTIQELFDYIISKGLLEDKPVLIWKLSEKDKTKDIVRSVEKTKKIPLDKLINI